jgi:hypothetical protein
MLDERRNLLPDDLQWFGMMILTQKIALFGFLKVEGKKMVVGVRTDGFCSKTGTLRELTCAAWVNMRKGNFGMAAGCEQNVLGGEQNSMEDWFHGPLIMGSYNS